MGKSAGVRRLVKDVADEVAIVARMTAPVDSGDYRDGIEVRMRETSYRAFAIVVGTDWKTMLVEAKTGNLVNALRYVARG
ncbi:HK97 gp10 family phage protein [Cryobacterium melibiosiphilum]|uniref:HK97 gp10 family phage protein n=2 Tax=Cryobacterium melibiosiphilum TaxID=995039 RepID=A0A3A5MM10_9MICO|nr:HK97 gp10 family phage protein [Cryobacterium melibiosiphilum]